MKRRIRVLFKILDFFNPDYTLGFVMKTICIIKFGAHGVFQNENICYMLKSKKWVSAKFCSRLEPVSATGEANCL